MGRAIDLLITYRVIKMLVTPWKQHDAYKLGIIDDNGKVLRKAKTLKSAKEKDSYTILHRFVFNLKRLLGLLPGGKTKFASYATALALLIKENKEFVLRIKEEIKNTDFSFLSDTANEKVEAEKIKIYEEIIHKCK